MVHVIATITLQPGKRDEWLEQFRAIVPAVHAEAGCIAYGPTLTTPTGLELQNNLDDDTVVVVEQWESVQHLKDHLDTPHMAAFFDATGDLTASLEVIVTEPV